MGLDDYDIDDREGLCAERRISTQRHAPSEATLSRMLIKMSTKRRTESPTTRRTFLAWGLAGLLGATVLSAIAPIGVYLWPYSKIKGLKIPIRLGIALAQLKDNVPVMFQSPAGQAFVLATGGGDNSVGDPAFAGFVVRGSHTANKTLVFAVNCPHLGCSVAFDSQHGIFKCPCHGSEFALDGAVIHGPAAAPLAQLHWSRSSNPDSIIVQGEDLVA